MVVSLDSREVDGVASFQHNSVWNVKRTSDFNYRQGKASCATTFWVVDGVAQLFSVLEEGVNRCEGACKR